MRNEFLAIVERVGTRHRAICPEVPEAQGLGHSKMAALVSLRDAVALVLDERRDQAIKAASAEAIFDAITID